MTGEQPDTEFRKGVEPDGCLDRFAGYAYADGHDRRPAMGTTVSIAQAVEAGERNFLYLSCRGIRSLTAKEDRLKLVHG